MIDRDNDDRLLEVEGYHEFVKFSWDYSSLDFTLFMVAIDTLIEFFHHYSVFE